MPTCKLCGLEAKLIKAHIIPKSFWDIDSTQPLKILTTTRGERPKRCRIGIYDSTIVCEKCERKFGDYDKYAAHILLKEADKFKPIKDKRRAVVGKFIGEFDYQKLKLFCIALLWRAGVSSHPFFGKVQLGAFIDQAADMLSRGDAGCPEMFATIFAVWNDVGWPLHMDPFQERYDGIKYYRFYLGSYLAYIKVDKRLTPKLFSNFVLSPGRPLVAVSRNFEKIERISADEENCDTAPTRVSTAWWGA